MTELEHIYLTYFKDVYLYIRRLSNNEHIAEEITSETFFKATKSIDKFRGDCDIRVWLCQIAKNCYYSYLKKSKRTDSLDDTKLSDIPAECDSAEDQLVMQDETMQIKKILHEIPDPYREVFMWRVYADLDFKEIGQIFNKSENWACVTYHRARNKIRAKLDEHNTND